MSENTKVEIKHVILPFDFSNSAKNALQHAISIANKLQADLTILSVMDRYSSQYLQYNGNRFVEFEAVAKEKLNELAKEVVTLGKTECVIYEASWSRAVSDLVKKTEGSLVVLGDGDKSRDGYFNGFHSHRIVDSLHIPVLVVKETQQVTDYKMIITPLDRTRQTREKLSVVTIVGRAFEAKVLIVGLLQNSKTESTAHLSSIMHQASKYIRVKVRQHETKIIPIKSLVRVCSKS